MNTNPAQAAVSYLLSQDNIIDPVKSIIQSDEQMKWRTKAFKHKCHFQKTEEENTSMSNFTTWKDHRFTNNLEFYTMTTSDFERELAEKEREESEKMKAKRKRITSRQLAVLNEVFKQTYFPNTTLREALACELDLSPRTIQIWFQNKRQAYRVKVKSNHNNFLLQTVRNDSDGEEKMQKLPVESGHDIQKSVEGLLRLADIAVYSSAD